MMQFYPLTVLQQVTKSSSQVTQSSSHIKSSHFTRIESTAQVESLISLKSSQWLQELHGEQKCEQKCFKKFPTSGKYAEFSLRITFHFFKHFHNSSQPI